MEDLLQNNLRTPYLQRQKQSKEKLLHTISLSSVYCGFHECTDFISQNMTVETKLDLVNSVSVCIISFKSARVF